MRELHLICRRDPNSIGRLGLYSLDKDNGIWATGKWDFSITEAERLIGGRIYLHESKSEKSAFGGEVRSVRAVIADDVSNENRVEFVFKASPDCKGVPWKGASHSMAWSSGII